MAKNTFGSKPQWRGAEGGEDERSLGDVAGSAWKSFVQPVRPFVDPQGNPIPGTGPQANKPAPPPTPASVAPNYAPWRNPELKAWDDMQEQQAYSAAPVAPDWLIDEPAPEPSANKPDIAPYRDRDSGMAGGYSGGSVGGYSMRNQRPQYAKWLDTYTVEAAANARDKNEIEQINLAEQARLNDVAEWNRQNAEEQQQILDGANKEMGMLREELGMASQMYREQLANTGKTYNPGGLASALIGLANAVFGGGPERGAAILDNLAKKDLADQKLLLQNSKRMEDSLLGRYEQITGDKDKAEQLYLAFVKDQQAAQARVLANKLSNVESRNRLNQKTAELVREREKIEYGIEESLYRERQAAARARAAAIQQQRLAQRSEALRAKATSSLNDAFALDGQAAADLRTKYGISQEQTDKIKTSPTYKKAIENLDTTKKVLNETKNLQRIWANYKGDDVPGVGFVAGRFEPNDFTNTIAMRNEQESEDAVSARGSLAAIGLNLAKAITPGNPSEGENQKMKPLFQFPTEGAQALGTKIDRAQEMMYEEAKYRIRNLPIDQQIVFISENPELFPVNEKLDKEISK